MQIRLLVILTVGGLNQPEFYFFRIVNNISLYKSPIQPHIWRNQMDYHEEDCYSTGPNL